MLDRLLSNLSWNSSRLEGNTYSLLETQRLFKSGKSAEGKAAADVFEQAFFTMVHLPSLQPFEDVNKRVSRFTVNISLVKGNLCPLSISNVP